MFGNHDLRGIKGITIDFTREPALASAPLPILR